VHRNVQILEENCLVPVSRLIKMSAIACLLVLGIVLTNTSLALAAPDQRRFSLAYFDLDLTYPMNGKPGETITIAVTATAKKDCEVQDLSVEFFAYSGSGDPRSIGSASVVKQTNVVSGNSFQKSTALTIPADAPRSFLMAVASETVRTYTYMYSYYYVYPYWWWYNASRYWWWHPVYYGYRSYLDTVDKETGPLTYILATTPEYTQLKADYDKLTSEYNKLSSDQAALNTRYNRLNDEYQRLLVERENLTQELALTRIFLYCLAVAVAVVAVVLYLQKRGHIVVTLRRQSKA